MNKWAKILLLGFISWVIPFVASFPMFPLMRSDEVFFKTIMIVVGGLTGMGVIIYYFKDIKKHLVKESALVGTVWLFLNWILDILILLPMSGQSLDRYFMEIGLRYLNLLIMTLGAGYLLESWKK